MEIAIVGGGIIAQTLALRLGTRGHDVCIIAPDEAPHMASTGNAGTIAAYAVDPVGTPDVLRDLPHLLLDRLSPLALHRPSILGLTPWLLRFLRQSLPGAAQANRAVLADLLSDAVSEWRDLAHSIGGADLMRSNGAVYAYDSAPALDAGRAAMQRRQAHGVTVEMLDQAELAALEPGLPAGRFVGGALFSDTYWMKDPAQMLAHVAAAHSAPRIAARVTGVARAGAGWSLRLDNGETAQAQVVIVAAGAWSMQLLRPLGLRIPLTAERGYHLEFDMQDARLPVQRPVSPVSLGFYLCPMAGRLRVAGTVELGGIDAPPSPHRWDRLEDGVRAILPDLPAVSRRWMGLRPSIPDSLPVIGQAQPGLFVAFGHGHLGLTLAPRTARIIDDALAGRAAPAALRPDRF